MAQGPSRQAIAFVVMAILLAACSVSEPRHGSAVQRVDADAAQYGLNPFDGLTDADQAPGPASANGGGNASGIAGSAVPGGQSSRGPAASGGSGRPEGQAGGSNNANQAPSSANEVGVTEDSITISWSTPRSGYLAPIIAAAEKSGLDVWVREVNENGGIHGRQVNIAKVDNQFTADGGIAACKEIQSNKSLMAVLYAGYTNESTCLEKAGVPEVIYLADQVDPAWKFQHYAQSVEIWGRNASSLVETVLKKGDTKIGVIYLQDLAYGFKAKDAFVERAKELGQDIVGVEGINQNQASFVPQLQRLQAAGAETVAVFAIFEIIGILRDARSLGFSPTWTGAGYAGVDAISSAARGVMDGVTGVSLFATSESPAYAEYARKVDEYGDADATPNTVAMQNYAIAVLLGEVLRAAGPNPTRASLIAGYDTIQNYDNQMMAPISWSPGQLAGAIKTFPLLCCNPDYSWKMMGPAGTFE